MPDGRVAPFFFPTLLLPLYLLIIVPDFYVPIPLSVCILGIMIGVKVVVVAYVEMETKMVHAEAQRRTARSVLPRVLRGQTLQEAQGQDRSGSVRTGWFVCVCQLISKVYTGWFVEWALVLDTVSGGRWAEL